MKKLFIALITVISCCAVSFGREVFDISRGWRFHTCDERDSVKVNLPHTWNDADALAGRVNYYRGTGNYLKYIHADPAWRGKRVFIRFYGAGTVTDLMVNGRHAGEHRGGNNAFEFEITDMLKPGERNLLWVIVNNGSRLDVLPTAGEDNVYGGIFRKVELIVTEPAAIGFDGYGGSGVLFSAGSVSEEKASGKIAVTVNSSGIRTVKVGVEIRDGGDSVVYSGYAKHRTAGKVSVAELPFHIERPRLWRGTEDPYLYTVTVALDDGGLTDSVSFRTGVRSFSVDSRTGFFLNGSHYPLMGVVLWRDQAVYGPIFSREHIRRDIGIIREMGANAVRVAGGSHCPEFYEVCDEEGIVVLSDSPFTGGVALDERGYYATGAFRDNALAQLREMIYQRYNNPSVMFWGIFADPEMIGDDPLPLIRELNATAKELDPLRLTVGVSNKDGDVNRITDLIVWNHTFGWKGGMAEDIFLWRDQLRADANWSALCSAVSYRTPGNVERYWEASTSGGFPRRGDHENRQAHIHEVYQDALCADSSFWAIFVGDMFDHGSAHYFRNRKGINGCGLVSFDRSLRKDVFWLYKANWNDKDPFVYIASKRHNVRTQPVQTVTVYSNLPEAELFLNGVSLGTRKAEKGVIRWENVTLRKGDNSLSVFAAAAEGADCEQAQDSCTLTLSPRGIL